LYLIRFASNSNLGKRRKRMKRKLISQIITQKKASPEIKNQKQIMKTQEKIVKTQ